MDNDTMLYIQFFMLGVTVGVGLMTLFLILVKAI